MKGHISGTNSKKKSKMCVKVHESKTPVLKEFVEIRRYNSELITKEYSVFINVLDTRKVL